MFTKKTGMGAVVAAGVAAMAITLAVVLSNGLTCSISPATIAQHQGGCGTDASARGPLTTKGHVVQTDPKIVLVFWGSSWRTQTFEKKVVVAEQALFKQLPGSSYNAILAQYGVHNDVKLVATVFDTREPPLAPGYNAFQAEILRAQQLSGQTTNNDVQWMVFPPSSFNPKNFRNECGEHDHFYFKHNGHLYVWSITQPFNNSEYDNPKDSCVEYDGGGTSAVGATTSLTSHEYAEAATDPIYANGQGWTSQHVAASWNEIGDLCYGQGIRLSGTPTVPGAVVQALWSNANEGPDHSRGCVQAASGQTIPQCIGGDNGGPCAYDFVPTPGAQFRKPLPPPPPISRIGDPKVK